MNIAAFFPPWLLTIPIGWMIAAVIFALLTFDAMRAGPGRASVIAMSAGISIFLYNLLPYTAFVGSFIQSSSKTIQAGIFALLFAAVCVLVYRMSSSIGGMSNGLIFSILAGLSATIALVVMWQQVVPLESMWNFGPQAHAIFGAPYALPWLLLVYLILAFVRS